MCPRPTTPIFAVVVAISCPPFDQHEVIVVEVDVGSADDRINLIRSTEADAPSMRCSAPCFALAAVPFLLLPKDTDPSRMSHRLIRVDDARGQGSPKA
jgi:hypothetical protein